MVIDILLRFFKASLRGFPTGVLVGFLVAFVIGTVLFLTFLGPKRGARFSAGLLLTEYMALILMVTVFCRKLLDVRGLHVIPFRSYWYIWEGGRFLVQVFMNVLAFVPIGLLLTSMPSRVEANALYQALGFEQRDTNVYKMNL